MLWALHDLVITGDPLFSLLGTQENAEALERRTGPVDLVLYGPRRLGEVLREPVLLGMVAGGVLRVATAEADRRSPRSRLALAAFSAVGDRRPADHHALHAAAGRAGLHPVRRGARRPACATGAGRR